MRSTYLGRNDKIRAVPQAGFAAVVETYDSLDLGDDATVDVIKVLVALGVNEDISAGQETSSLCCMYMAFVDRCAKIGS